MGIKTQPAWASIPVLGLAWRISDSIKGRRLRASLEWVRRAQLYLDSTENLPIEEQFSNAVPASFSKLKKERRDLKSSLESFSKTRFKKPGWGGFLFANSKKKKAYAEKQAQYLRAETHLKNAVRSFHYHLLSVAEDSLLQTVNDQKFQATLAKKITAVLSALPSKGLLWQYYRRVLTEKQDVLLGKNKNSTSKPFRLSWRKRYFGSCEERYIGYLMNGGLKRLEAFYQKAQGDLSVKIPKVTFLQRWVLQGLEQENFLPARYHLCLNMKLLFSKDASNYSIQESENYQRLLTLSSQGHIPSHILTAFCLKYLGDSSVGFQLMELYQQHVSDKENHCWKSLLNIGIDDGNCLAVSIFNREKENFLEKLLVFFRGNPTSFSALVSHLGSNAENGFSDNQAFSFIERLRKIHEAGEETKISEIQSLLKTVNDESLRGFFEDHAKVVERFFLTQKRLSRLYRKTSGGPMSLADFSPSNSGSSASSSESSGSIRRVSEPTKVLGQGEKDSGETEKKRDSSSSLGSIRDIFTMGQGA